MLFNHGQFGLVGNVTKQVSLQIVIAHATSFLPLSSFGINRFSEPFHRAPAPACGEWPCWATFGRPGQSSIPYGKLFNRRWILKPVIFLRIAPSRKQSGSWRTRAD